jgi:NitT/TauT family transport system ATP-binding protein
MGDAHVEIQGVTVLFSGEAAREAAPALRDVNLSIRRGEFFCIVGPSGCGKTSLLHLLAGFLKPSLGKVAINGEAVTGPSKQRVMVFQENGLFPWRTVLQNVTYPLEVKKLARGQCEKIARYYLRLVGLEGYQSYYPSQLSGGMKQRVQLARSLSVNPEIIFMDEPFGALDAITAEKLEVELGKIWEREGKTIVYVTHDIQSALRLGDRIAIMQSAPGRIKNILEVDLPRPRERDSADFLNLERRLRRELGMDTLASWPSAINA